MVGLFIGAYDYLQLEAYDYNCYSQVFDFFMFQLPDASKYFDTGIPDDGWVETSLFWFEMAAYSFTLT